jgi:hypothetical protein
MKKALLTIVLIVLTLGCSSSKKTSQIKEKTTKESELAINSQEEKEHVVQSDKTAKQKETNTATETVVKYTPKTGSDGKFIPFKYQNTTGGKPQTIEVNGNGEVLIRTIQNELSRSSEETKKDIENLRSEYLSQIKQGQKELLEKESEVVEIKRSVFKLWVAVVVLSLLLLVSIYFHISRTTIPFLRK